MNTPTKIPIERHRVGGDAGIDRSWQLAAAAAAGWLAVGVLGLWDAAAENGGEGAPYLLFAIALLLSAALTVAAAWSSTRPTKRNQLRKWGLGFGLLAGASAVVAWAGPMWMTTIALSLAVFATAAPRALRPGLVAIAVGQLFGVAVTIAAIEAEVGSRDSYGNWPDAEALGIVAASLGSIIGLALLIRAARAAEPRW